MGSDSRRRGWLTHERRVTLMVLGAALPAVVIAGVLLWTGDFPARTRLTLALIMAGSLAAGAFMVHERIARPLQTLSNMLAALREGDFSLRGRSARSGDALGLALLEANLLGETLRTQRLGALEATALLRAAMSEIDVAVFAFDESGSLRLVNQAGEALLGGTAGKLLGRQAAELDLYDALHGEAPRVIDAAFRGGKGRWEVRRRLFRQGGRPHTLLVLADVTRALREEELLAWQRLVRVLGHEINNSLTPIKSIAVSLQSLLDRPLPVRPGDAEDDLRRGLAVIGGRAEALSRFMSAYAQLARLPAPEPAPLDVPAWVQRVVALEPRLRVSIVSGGDLVVSADGDQLDQLLINLVRNAVDAALETRGGVRVGWERDGVTATIWVEDDGPGLSGTANLFVPFFTTKPGGTGIGLVLCRQIAEAHRGTLTLENREGASGCVARLRLPIETAGPAPAAVPPSLTTGEVRAAMRIASEHAGQGVSRSAITPVRPGE